MSLWFLKDICNISIIHDIDRIARINPDLACCDYFYALKYADFVLRDRFPEGEPIIATNAKSSYGYAYSVLKGRFSLGEPIIATDDYCSYSYAVFVLHGPFPLGEPVIAKDTHFADAYTYYVLKHDFYLDGELICEYEV